MKNVFINSRNVEDLTRIRRHAKYEELHSDDITQVSSLPILVQ